MPLRTISVCSNGIEGDSDCGNKDEPAQSTDGKRSENVTQGNETQPEDCVVNVPVEAGSNESEKVKVDVVLKTSSNTSEQTSSENTPEPSIAESQSDAYSSFSGDICRICHSEASAEEPLIEPCICSGSLRFVHLKCLQQWIKSVDTKTCELCKFNFVMTSKVKPFRTWQKLDMSSLERRKVLCSVAFHVIAITCVVWSLYVLIDRTTEEVNEGNLEWPFWTKLIVVAIGFTGGLVFMYVQCKMYIQLCKRWRAYNRIIYIQNCPPEAGQEMRVMTSTQQPPPPIDIEPDLF